MKFKKLGILLLIASIGISSANFTLTGAVIGAGIYSWLTVLAVVLFIVGVLVIFAAGSLEQKVREGRVVLPFDSVKGAFNRNFPGYETVIVDSSFLITYANEGERLLDYLASYKNAIVPQEVLDEIGGKNKNHPNPLKGLVEANSKRPDEGYKQFLPMAREALNQGSKAYMKDLVVAVINGEEQAPMYGDADYRSYSNAMSRLSSNLAKKNREDTKENLLAEANRSLGVSAADAAVLACAMAEGKKGSRSVILEKDVDFEEVFPTLNSMGHRDVHYFNAYGKAR